MGVLKEPVITRVTVTDLYYLTSPPFVREGAKKRRTRPLCKRFYKRVSEEKGHGDLGWKLSAEKAYFKQKHRMIWERRHGKIGTGMVGNRPEGVNVEESTVNDE
ncbi:hypothetical protein J6590_005354 [Homalodisca vitripennis]|nr:hypothetical protein J6590_005354 [Homalodisca vitripennis]